MKHLIWYIRSMFCKHEWDYEEKFYKSSSLLGKHKTGYVVSATCKNCGWHRSYNKFKI